MDLDALQSKFEIMPGRVTVKYKRRVGDVLAEPVEVPNVERRPVARRDNMLTTTAAVWHFWSASLGGIEPRNGDHFDIDTPCGACETWVVTDADVTAELLGARYRVTAAKAR